MTWVFIQPQDVLLFRDGKPFSSGEDHSAQSMFPPTPLTVQGAMRQKISMSLGVSLQEYRQGNSERAKQSRDYIGPPSADVQTGLFEMRGSFIGICVDGIVHQLLPAPVDLYKFDKKYTRPEDIPDNLKDCIKPETKSTFRIARLNQKLSSDLAEDMLLLEVIDGYENMGGSWLTADLFNAYLDGKAPDKNHLYSRKKCQKDASADDAESKQETEDNDNEGAMPNLVDAYEAGTRIFSNSMIYQTEGRVGVSTDAQTSFRDPGLLYQAQFIRMNHDAGLLVDVQNIPENLLVGTMTIGGEQRPAVAQNKHQTEVIRPNPQSVSGKFKVIILTPAYFDGGWQPENGFAVLFGQDVALRGAALGRPQRIGGWSNLGKSARAMHHYVAPGSVYYFDAGTTTIQLPPAFTQTPTTIDDAAKIGFGQYAVATAW